MLWKCSFQDQCRALLSSTSPGKLFVSLLLLPGISIRVSQLPKFRETSSGQRQRLQPDAGSRVLAPLLCTWRLMGNLSSSRCWRTTGKDILLTSIYSTSGWRGRLSHNRQNKGLPLAENSHTGSKLQLPSALRMGKQQRRNVQLQL